MRIPPDLFLLNKALVYLEGIGRKLDPDFNAVEEMRPFIKKVMGKKISPIAFGLKLKKTLEDFFILFQESPTELREIMSLVKKGEIKVNFDEQGLKPLLNKQEELSNRLGFSIIAGALIIGSSLMVLSRMPPFVFGIPLIAFIGFFVAGLMGFKLLIDIFRSRKI